MAQITNPEAIKFVNEQIRPLAERIRNLKAVLDDAQGEWNGGGLSAHFSNGGDTLEDGREGEGVSRLTAQDVTNLVNELGQIITQLDATAMNVIRLPCVRPMSVTSS